MSHGSLTLKQEKAMLEQIKELKKGRSLVVAYEQDQKVLDGVREQHSAQQAETKPLNLNFDQLKAAATEKGEAMDKLMAAKQEQRNARDTITATHAALKAEVDGYFEKV